MNEVLDSSPGPHYLWHRYDLQKEADQLKHKLSPIEFETYRGDRLPRNAELFLKCSDGLRGYDVEAEFSTPVCTLAAADVSRINGYMTGVNARENNSLSYLLETGLLRKTRSHYAVCSIASTQMDDQDFHTVTPKQVVVRGSIVPAERWNSTCPHLPIVAIKHLEQYRGNSGTYEGKFADSVRIGFLLFASKDLVTISPEIVFQGEPYFLQEDLPGDRSGDLSRYLEARFSSKIPWVHVEEVSTFGLEDWRPKEAEDEQEN